ncbi:MAG: DUF3006 domain-containing protein [Clostridia bacterium]|nr:DUF3006 domain-containing protein [Clostridia bacterium]
MKITVDRIEGSFIVAELPDGSFGNLPLIFAPDAREGDIISIETDKEESQQRSEEIKSRMSRLFNK